VQQVEAAERNAERLMGIIAACNSFGYTDSYALYVYDMTQDADLP
jgi:hypothetical protein